MIKSKDMIYVVRESFGNHTSNIIVTPKEELAVDIVKLEIINGKQRYLEIWYSGDLVAEITNYGFFNGKREYGVTKFMGAERKVVKEDFDDLYKELKEALEKKLIDK